MKKHFFVFFIIFSMLLPTTVKAVSCYCNWYFSSNCGACNSGSYDNTQKDSCKAKHPRQYGVKLCSSHMQGISAYSSYYKRGYSDYNCLAYALGNNGVQSWTWPASWGTAGPSLSSFESWIRAKGYNCTKNAGSASGTNIIYVYGVTLNGVTYVKHFARKYTLDGKKVSGAETISKWGACSLYTTSKTDPYTASSSYGNLVLICYR